MGLAETGRAIAEGNVSAEAVTEAFLDAIAAHEASADIYCHVTGERARREAQAAGARQRAGRLAGPLDGVPISWKDLFDTKGDPVESGAPMLRGRTGSADAEVVDNASAAGMVCLGKTHQTEFAFSGLGINPNTSTPPNRDFPGCTPGGSSSGAAASVVHGLAAGGIGSDTGGSVRIPACWNSLVGMKTTHGLVSNAGTVALCPGFDTVGPLVRNVEDAALMTSVLAGLDLAGRNLAGGAPPDPGALRLAIAEGIPFEETDGEVASGFEDAVGRLERAGVHVEQFTPSGFGEALQLGATLFPFEAWREWGELIEANPGIMYPPVERRFRQGGDVSEADYRKAGERLLVLRAQFAGETKGFDAIIMPTTAILPRPVEALLGDAEAFTATNLLALRNTRFANLFGTCALTLPTAQKGCGLQLMGREMEDGRLLAMGRSLERLAAG